MIVEYPGGKGRKGPDCWYTYTYENGIRATLSEYQGDLEDLEELGRRLSREKGREVRMNRHSGRSARLHAIFDSGRRRRLRLRPLIQKLFQKWRTEDVRTRETLHQVRQGKGRDNHRPSQER